MLFIWLGMTELRVEVAHGGYLPERALKHGLTVQVSWLCEYLAADHLLVGDGVSADDDLVERRGLAFHHAELDIHGVPHDIGLHRNDIEEYVTLVSIQRMDIHELFLGISEKPLLEIHHVIHVSLLDHQHGIELVSRIEGVACPRDVAEVVPLPLVDDEVYAQTVLLYIIYGVLDDTGVPVSGLVERAYEGLLVVVILLLVEFL